MNLVVRIVAVSPDVTTADSTPQSCSSVRRRRARYSIETAGHKQAKAEIKGLNEELVQRVLERTSELMAVNSELTKKYCNVSAPSRRCCGVRLI